MSRGFGENVRRPFLITMFHFLYSKMYVTFYPQILQLWHSFRKEYHNLINSHPLLGSYSGSLLSCVIYREQGNSATATRDMCEQSLLNEVELITISKIIFAITKFLTSWFLKAKNYILGNNLHICCYNHICNGLLHLYRIKREKDRIDIC